MELELCYLCDEPTGKAGAGDGSIYDDNGTGPFCEQCWEEHELASAKATTDSIQSGGHREEIPVG